MEVCLNGNSKINSWDEYFSNICVLIAKKSEDESTQCGSVIVTPTNEIISTGYNDFPRGIKNIPERQERPIKYKYFEHAERGAVYNCARNGIKTFGCKIYVTGIPCADCARAIIQCGLNEVIAIKGLHDESFYERWKESIDFTIQLFKEADINFREYKIEELTLAA